MGKDKLIKPSYYTLEKSNNQSLEIYTWIIKTNKQTNDSNFFCE